MDASVHDETKQDFETGIAVAFIVIVVSAVVLNTMVIFALLNPIHKRRLRDKLILSMSCCDLVRIVITGPLEIRGLLNHRFDEEGNICKVLSFSMYFCEYSSVAHLTLIVLDRYICTTKPYLALKLYLDPNTAIKQLVFAYSFGLFWAILPLVGVGRYGFQIPYVQCGLEPLHNTATKTYITLILICVITLSLLIAFICIHKIWKKLKSLDNNMTEVQTNQAQEMMNYIKEDKKQLQMVLSLTIMFACTWLVYDVGLFEEIYTTNERNEYLEVTTTCIGQSSAMIAPLLCLCFYKNIRVTLRRSFTKVKVQGRKRQSTVMDVSTTI